MRRLLDRAGRRILADLAERRAALCFDYDGTLAPIARDFHQVKLRARTRELLGGVTERWPCALLTGRARADAAELATGIPFKIIVGNHGAEMDANGVDHSRVRAAVGRWHRALGATLRGKRGIEIEDKRISLSIHYRRAPHPAEAHRAIDVAVAALQGVRIVGGKRVVNVVPKDAPHKGTAVFTVLRRLRCTAGLVVGDDVTDEDAFLAARAYPALISVRVGRSSRSAADWFLEDQAEIDDLLALLLSLRT